MNTRWLLGKVGAAVLTLVFVLIFTLLPLQGRRRSDRAARAPPESTPEEIAELRAEYGLDKPLMSQFTDYLGDTFMGELGSASARANRSGTRSRGRFRGRSSSSASGP